MRDKRQHIRTALKARVKVIIPGQDEVMMTLQDMSNGGLFLICDNNALPEIGTVVKVQVQGMLEDAPIIEGKVVRHTREGFGLAFVD